MRIIDWSSDVCSSDLLGGDMTLTPRFDLAYTGDSYGSIFNGNVNKIQGYAQVNAQVQINGADDKWFVKGFIQNIFDANSVTGLYIPDQSSVTYPNTFTLHPRPYAISAVGPSYHPPG